MLNVALNVGLTVLCAVLATALVYSVGALPFRRWPRVRVGEPIADGDDSERRTAERIERTASVTRSQRWAALFGDDVRSGESAGALGAVADGGSSPKTVLIADDDFDLAQALAIRLTQIGLHAVRTCDALHALIGVHKLLPDLIIIDVNLPSGNGLAVCEMLACDPQRAMFPSSYTPAVPTSTRSIVAANCICTTCINRPARGSACGHWFASSSACTRQRKLPPRRRT